MDKKGRSVLHMEVLDGEFQEDLTQFHGREDELLTMLTMAVHFYLEGVGFHYRRLARRVLRDELKGVLLTEEDEQDERDEKLTTVLMFVTGCFALIGAFVSIAWLVTKIAGVVG